MEVVGVDELGWHAPYALVHHLEGYVSPVPGVGGFLAWVVNTLCSAVIGLVVGAVVVAIMHVLPFGKKEHDSHDVPPHADVVMDHAVEGTDVIAPAVTDPAKDDVTEAATDDVTEAGPGED